MADRRQARLTEPADPSGGGQGWTWTMVERKGQKPAIYCSKSITFDQFITGLRTVATLSEFHDETLATATKEINAILDNVKAANRDNDRELAFINTGNGLLLAWTEDAVSAFDKHSVIADALGLDPIEDSKV